MHVFLVIPTLTNSRLIIIVSYGHEIAARAATPELRTRGGQFVVVRETPGSYPGGTPVFGPHPFLVGVRVN